MENPTGPGPNRFGTTAAEEARGESLDERLAEEEPDIDPYAELPDDEDELTRRGDQTDAGAASAEEAAVHVVDDPNGTGDGPLR